MGGIVMIPETVADGQWLGRDSDRIRFQVALQAEQRRLRDLVLEISILLLWQEHMARPRHRRLLPIS